jgi:hypothetical protein
MTFARLRLAPFFEEGGGNLPVPPESPLPTHGPEDGP